MGDSSKRICPQTNLRLSFRAPNMESSGSTCPLEPGSFSGSTGSSESLRPEDYPPAALVLSSWVVVCYGGGVEAPVLPNVGHDEDIDPENPRHEAYHAGRAIINFATTVDVRSAIPVSRETYSELALIIQS